MIGSRRLVLVLAGLAIALGATAATALANHGGNPEVGPYGQASVTCDHADWSDTMTLSPLVGASTLYDSQRVHNRVSYYEAWDPWNGTYMQKMITPYTQGFSRSIRLARGQYAVWTMYAWLTSTGWVQSDWVPNTTYKQYGTVGESFHCFI